MKFTTKPIHTLEMNDKERQTLMSILNRVKTHDTDLQNDDMLTFIDNAISCMVIK